MQKVVKNFETQVIGHFKVWVLQCLEWVDLGTFIMFGCHLFYPILGRICELSFVGKRIQQIPSNTMLAYSKDPKCSDPITFKLIYALQ
jgi:hypothetical protein